MDCETCTHKDLSSFSATCVECGIAMKNYKPITNADRVRAMTDEELALYLDNMQGLAYINGFDSEPIRLYPNNYGAWLDWLRQEVDNAEDQPAP